MFNLVDITWQVFAVLHHIASFFNPVWPFLNSQFSLTLLGTMISAFAGVVGAHIITERFKRREQLLRELRITNAAIMTSFEICNSMLNLKEQHTKGMEENYTKAKSDFEAFDLRRKANLINPGEIFYFQADFQTLNPMLMPSDILLKQVFEQISSPARALTLTSTLHRTIDSLNQTIKHRNELVDGWKKRPLPNRHSQDSIMDELVPFYFGLPQRGGHTDTSFPNSIEGICSLTDDCIIFSSMLCSDLVKHGQSLKKRFGRKSPQVNTPYFDKALAKGLMPDDTKYKDWEKMFVKHKKSKWKKFISRFSKKSKD